MVGMDRDRLYLLDYSEEWKESYLDERNKLLTVEKLKNIEHIGSTSIEGMLARPIIDMAFEYSHEADEGEIIKELEGLGYEYLGEEGIESRLFFSKMLDGKIYHTISGHLEGDENYNNYLVFRDYLGQEKKYRDEYRKLKDKLCKKYRGDEKRYSLGKVIFIKFILKKAKLERKP